MCIRNTRPCDGCFLFTAVNKKSANNLLIKKSPLKDVYFTHDYTLKSKINFNLHNSDYKSNIWMNMLNNINTTTTKKYLFLDLILLMLNPNPIDRITAHDALKHPLYKMFHFEPRR